jgi:hypothetical protein
MTIVVPAWDLQPGDLVLAVEGIPAASIPEARAEKVAKPGALLPVAVAGRPVLIAPAARCEVNRG